MYSEAVKYNGHFFNDADVFMSFIVNPKMLEPTEMFYESGLHIFYDVREFKSKIFTNSFHINMLSILLIKWYFIFLS